MDNISWSKAYMQRDNGERTLHWIKCSSRMPSEEGLYLLTVVIDEKSSVVCEYYKNNTFKTFLKDKVVAWTFLPEPYKIK